MQDSPPLLEDYVALFTKPKYLTFANTPRGLAKAYHDTKKADETATDKIVFDAGGFLAWLPYLLASRAVKRTTHYDGQAADQQLLESFNACPSELRQQVAQHVSQAISDHNRTRFQDIFEKTIQSSQDNDLVVVPQKRRRTHSPFLTSCPSILIQSGMIDRTSSPTPVSPSPAASANSPGTSIEPSRSSSRFIVGNPPILKVAAVFPPYLARAIRKYQQSPGTPWVAAITMSFLDFSSFGNKLGSMMSLEITKNKVERLANTLFGADIESTDGHRYLILPTGLRVLSTSDLVLRGCKRDVIAEVFGEDIAIAIEASPAFKEENDLGEPLTECVSMSISGLSNEGAVINLSLDEKEGVRVKAKLYNVS